MNQESKRQITLEDIIRLKRAERPPSQFWTQFDRELRAKQLAALLEKRPWWRGLAWRSGGISRYALPLGAAAILAVAFVATRSSNPMASASVQEVGLSVERFAVAAPVVPMNSDVQLHRPAAQVAESEVASASLSESIAETTSPNSVLEPGDAPVATFVSFGSSLVAQEPTLAVDRLVVAPASETGVHNGLFAAGRIFGAAAETTRSATVEPLSQMGGPAAASRARFNSAFAASYNKEGSNRPSERVARRLSNEGEERLYEGRVSRIKVRGDALDWKL